jgi:NAD(P)-dependent dehydrogenase (short-subunit alcohol dehydrogenase family)
VARPWAWTVYFIIYGAIGKFPGVMCQCKEALLRVRKEGQVAYGSRCFAKPPHQQMEQSMSGQVILVTGASSGIGEAAALRLSQMGHTVYGAARRVERMRHLADSGIRVLAMDVTQDASMQAAIETIIAREGRLDVLVNNAGYGSYGALEDVPMEEARAQFEVNVFGAVRLIQLALPHMRVRRSGTIVNITSMGGKIHTPLGGWYHGTKFALEAISDCLRMELRPFGIDVVVIEPGGIRTEWAGIAADQLRKTSGHGPYGPQAEVMAQSMTGEASLGRQSPPQIIADTIARAVKARHPKTRYAAGFAARPTIFLRWLLSDRAFDGVMRRATGLSKVA